MLKVKPLQILCHFLVLWYPAAVSAQSFNLCEYTPKQVSVAFSNGVGNTQSQAIASRVSTLRALQQGGDNSHPSAALVAEDADDLILYHQNNGISRDFAEVLLQKLRVESRNQEISWNNIVNLIKGSPGYNPLTLSQYLSALSDLQMDRLKAVTLQRIEDEGRSDYNKIYAHLAKWDKRKIIIIGHSQGTLYANAVFDAAEKAYSLGAWGLQQSPRDLLRVVAVGGAADRVAGQPQVSGPPQYVTSHHDAVIGALASIAPSLGINPPLAPNNYAANLANYDGTSGGLDPDIFMNHGYVATYLRDNASNYPLKRLLRNVLLEDIDVISSSKAAEVQIEVYINATGAYGSCDSTCIPPSNNYTISRAFQLEGRKFAPSASSDGKPYIEKREYKLAFGCRFAESLNLRPDHRLGVVRDNVHNDSYPFMLNGLGATIRSARFRVVAANGAVISGWRAVDVSRASVIADSYLHLPLFNYSMSLKVGALSMTIH